MATSFRFSPFHQQQPVAGTRGSQSHYGNNEDTVKLNKDLSDQERKAAPDQEGVHYGKAHAETEERYKERAENKEEASDEEED